ncbi:MAG: DUF1638 domain-containing protein [Eubacteriaceae bacterium]|nr:DUF1638 domain-containing protein [Eubacteriaceae bacterium]
MKTLLIGCEVVKAEVEAAIAETGADVDTLYVDQGLHSVGSAKMPQELQKVIDSVDQSAYSAILLFYGLCNNGIVGLKASIPMVIPRGHDCITFFMGSKERYREYFDSHPGVSFWGSGWNEDLFREQDFEFIDMRAKFAEDFGEDNADYLMEVLGNPMKNYRSMVFVNTGTGDVERYRSSAKRICRENSWEYDEYIGDRRIFLNALAGDWHENDFLVLQPSETVLPSFDEFIIKASSAQPLP